MSNLKYHTVLFDLDGTLLNSKMGFWRSFEYALEKLGYPDPHIDVIEPYIGPPIEKVFTDMFDYSYEDGMRGRAYFMEEYRDHGVMLTDPFFPGTSETIAKLKSAGILPGVCTNKSAPNAIAIVLNGNIGIPEKQVTGYDPDPDAGCTCKEDIITTFLRRFDLDAPEKKKGVLMVGDRNTDIIGADNVGIDGAAVTWGNGSREELEETDALCIADSFDELLTFIGV